MVVIEQEPETEEIREAHANAPPAEAPAHGEHESDEESFEDALTEEELREVRPFIRYFMCADLF